MEDQEWKEGTCVEEAEKELAGEESRFGNSGMSTVEIILILVVLIALVIIFKSQITALVSSIFTSINENAAKIY